MATPAKVLVGLLVGLLVVGGGVTAWLLATAPEPVEGPDTRSPAAVAAWCQDVEQAFAGGAPLGSFAEVAAAAIDGDLTRPRQDPPVRDPAALDRWQRVHAAYLTSSYLALFDLDPHPVTWQGVQLRVALDAAHAGEPIDHPADVRAAARALDRFRADRC